jgi:uncharacterized membrane protein HdeD (DUF308 family)
MSFVLGLVTLVLGVILAARPTGALTVIAVLLGVTMIVSGVFHIVRALDGRENARVWRGISGVLFIVAGLVLIRHLDLSLALIGLFIGFTWIIQGVLALMESVSGGRGRSETGWSVLFGVISLIAGIVVVSWPIASVRTLTTFLGVWFIVMGLMQMIGAVIVRRGRGGHGTGPVSVPGQRASDDSAGDRARGAAKRARQ